MATATSLRCTHCGKALPELSRKVAELQGELARLRRASHVHYDNGPYLGTSRKKLFHRPDCRWLADVPSHALLKFPTHAEAVRDGRKPCKTCCA